ncbi:MAG: permease-like cell division protein FtsX [Patescibacteria group bacterium]
MFSWSYPYRVLKFALQDFYRNIWLSLVTITILVLTLLSVNFLIVFNHLTKTAVSLVEQKIDVSVYFKSSVTEDQIGQMKSYVLNLPEVSTVEYVSQEKALAEFKQKHQDNEAILGAIAELDSNPLGATLRVKAHKVDGYPAILSAIDKAEYNQLISRKDYDDHQVMIGQISNITERIREVGILIVLIFAVIASLIVFNTIRVAIYTHRQEIATMKLVGATNWFVRLPFVVESIFYSILGLSLTMIVLFPLLKVFQPYLALFFGTGQFNVIDYFLANFGVTFGIELVAIILLNIISSYIAISRYLKV